MRRKPRLPRVPSSFVEGDMSLAVKDGLREVHFNLKRGARKLVSGVQTAIHPEGGKAAGPAGLLSSPLDLALRTTVQVLRNADHAAIDLLSSDGRYRAMEVPLCSSSAYFTGEHAVDAIRPFSRDHRWRYRHLLDLRGEDSMFVHEQRIERAGQQMRATWGTAVDDADQAPQLLNARIVKAFEAAEVLTPALDAEPERPEEARALSHHLALCVVLAGEIGPRLPGPVAEQTADALRLADEIVTANREPLARVRAHVNADAALASWMAFALRHI